MLSIIQFYLKRINQGLWKCRQMAINLLKHNNYEKRRLANDSNSVSEEIEQNNCANATIQKINRQVKNKKLLNHGS